MRTRRWPERFWKRVQKDGPDGCWLWTGTLNKDGYGQTTINYRGFTSHRMSWEMANGPIPAGLWVLHRCDVRACVNPAHLFLGTIRDNVADMDAKGRRRGETSSRRLSSAQVLEIRRRHAGGEPINALARETGFTKASVRAVVRGQSWRQVGGHDQQSIFDALGAK